MSGRQLARVAALAATWVVIAIHLDLLNDHLAEAPYLGALFIVGVVLLIPVVHALARNERYGSAVAFGALVQMGMLVGVVLSRTVGLPGLEPESWTDDHSLGVVTATAECIYLAAAFSLRRAPVVARMSPRR